VTGGVEGIVGTPQATPPATDAALPAAPGEGWRAVLFGLAILTGAAMLLLPSRRPLGARPVHVRRDEDRSR
jgi:hypothetical protein